VQQLDYDVEGSMHCIERIILYEGKGEQAIGKMTEEEYEKLIVGGAEKVAYDSVHQTKQFVALYADPKFKFESPRESNVKEDIIKYKKEIELRAGWEEVDANVLYLLSKSKVARTGMQRMIDTVVACLDLFCYCSVPVFPGLAGVTKYMQYVMSE
jgi:hypothetical protein